MSGSTPISTPRVYSCTEWGALPPRYESDLVRPGGIVLHHTTGPASGSADLAGAFSTAAAIQRAHLGQGWADTGQHLLLASCGVILEGRRGTVKNLIAKKLVPVGAHAGHPAGNHRIGIECDGYFHEDSTGKFRAMEQKQFDALLSLLAWICHHMGFKPDETIDGHRDWTQTACPGSWLYARLGLIRDGVLAQMCGAVPAPDLQHPSVRYDDKPIKCHAKLENGVTRVDLRVLAETLGFDLDVSGMGSNGIIDVVKRV